jgi:hypothetical protein
MQTQYRRVCSFLRQVQTGQTAHPPMGAMVELVLKSSNTLFL